MKTTKISIILLLILCFILVIGLGFILGLGLTNKNFIKKHFIINTNKKVLYNDYQPANKIVVDSDSYDVNFYYHDEDRILVKVTGPQDDTADVSTNNDTLNINVKTTKHFNVFIFNIINNKIDIYLPRNYELPIAVTLRTGDIRFKETNNSLLDLKTTTGDIYLKNAKGATLKTTTGDIKITDTFDSGSIKVTTGDIKVKNALGTIDFKTTTGEIKIDKAELTGKSNIKCSTGDVRIDAINDIYINADTNTGEVKVKHSNRFSDIELNIKTTTGDIRVK